MKADEASEDIMTSGFRCMCLEDLAPEPEIFGPARRRYFEAGVCEINIKMATAP